MKLNKLFMLGLAGLAFAACSNDEEVAAPEFNGLGAVSVKVSNASLTRALTEGVDGDKVAVDGQMTITLTAIYGDATNASDKSVTISTTDLRNGKNIVKFWNVVTPQKLTATINGGVVDYTKVALADVQQLPADIPAYGETTTFTKTAGSDTPIEGAGNEAGAVAGDYDKTYQMYTATVTMAIPVARLEVGTITHKDHGDAECLFATLTADGIYMDGLTAVGGVYADSYLSKGIATDYYFAQNLGTGTGVSPLLTAFESAIDFMTEPIEANQAWNFYANGTNPIFKIYFATATGSDDANPVSQPRYAMVTDYKDAQGESVTMEAGKIYRITKAELDDKNIIGDEGGNTLYGVEVTVVEAEWTIVETSVDWAE